MSILIRTVWNNVKYGLIPIMSKPFPNFYLHNKIAENLKATVFYLRNEEPQMSKTNTTESIQRIRLYAPNSIIGKYQQFARKNMNSRVKNFKFQKGQLSCGILTDINVNCRVEGKTLRMSRFEGTTLLISQYRVVLKLSSFNKHAKAEF